MNRISHKTTPAETEAHKQACLSAWLDNHARRIAAMPTVEARREALLKFRGLRSEVEARVRKLWRERYEHK